MPENTNPGDGGTGTQGAPAQGTGAQAPAGEAPKLVSMTQEDFDRVIADRVARAKPKDYDELVALRESTAAAAEKEKSDLQKEKDRAAAAEAKTAETEARANRILKVAAITAEAAAQNAADTDTVVALLASDESITIDGETVKGAKQAVKKLLEDKPFLVKASQTPGSSGGQFGGNDQQTLDERIKQAEANGDWAEARRLKMDKFHASRA